MVTKTLMGIDLGTSSVKTIIIDRHGKLLGSAACEYGIDIPKHGYAEQDPETWYTSAVGTIKDAMAEAAISPAQVEAIGLCGQMHGLVCMDAAGKTVRPAIIWPDQRSRRQVERINQTIGKQKLGEWTGNPLATGFMLVSWLWLLENEPETVRRTHCLLLPKDYLRYRLTGQIGSEPSDASASLMFDILTRSWCHPLLETLGIDPSLMPGLHESQQIAGALTPVAAKASGLMAGTPVIFGGADQATQAIGRGLTGAGVLSCAIATGGQLVTLTDAPRLDPAFRLHCLCHTFPQQWYLMAATLSAGLSLRWFRDNIARGMSYQDLADLAAATQDADGLYFLPHLAGERTPYMDPQSRGLFWGLALHHHLGHMARAIMEGVVFSLRLGLDLILELGVPIERVIASGGGTKHQLWLNLMANIFERPIYIAEAVDAAPLGAAMLAGISAGMYADIQQACQIVTPPPKVIIQPDPARVERYRAIYRKYKLLYPAVKPLI